MNTHKSLWCASQPKERLMSIRNETAETEPGPVTTGLKRVVAASMAGTVVEWYEFFLYATAIAAGTWSFFAFPMMNSANYLIIMSAIIIGLVIHAFMYAPQPAIMAEMFPTRMRYSGVSLGYQVTSIVAGSVAPAIATWLLDKYHSSVPIALYLACAAVVTLVAALFMRETNGIDLASVDQADREELAKAGVV
jgi:MFS family permease